ncbi:MAG: YqaJ viral recombinase family protein, partial [Deltaproteobacteria bacterium]|nr:YqaJ viral recombinase family protein [Deltaproteobacteria bacterium]
MVAVGVRRVVAGGVRLVVAGGVAVLTIFKYTAEAEWLALRLDDVTSTESAALFGLSPYLTEFELFHYKSTHTSGNFEESERMKWGKRFEKPIAEGIAEDLGIQVEPFKVYMRHATQRGMGSSF